MDNLYWVGTKESDISDVSNLYKGSVTLFGSNKNGNISFSSIVKNRINHNVYSSQIGEFWEAELQKIIIKEPDAQFMFYNPSIAYSLSKSIQEKTICLNDKNILNFLQSKINSKLVYSNLISTVSSKLFMGNDCTYANLKEYFPSYSSFVIQADASSGGFGTFIITANNSLTKEINKLTSYIVSPYIETSIPINIHLILSKENYLLSQPSIQIIEIHDNMLLYKGADFISYKELDDTLKQKIIENSKIIAKHLMALGYKGICGVDFIVSNNEVYFLEINNRFQSSTALINKVLIDNNLLSINELNIKAFNDNGFSIDDSIDVEINCSCYNHICFNKQDAIDYYLEKANNSNLITKVEYDGYNRDSCEPFSYLFKSIFNTNITSICPDSKVRLHDNLKYINNDHFHLGELKFRLINQGVSLSQKAIMNLQREGGFSKAVFNAIDIKIEDIWINTPIDIKLTSISPFNIDLVNGKYILRLYNNILYPVMIERRDSLSSYKTSNNISFNFISKLATDRLRIHHRSICYFKEKSIACLFCNLPQNGADFSIDDIKEVIDKYIDVNNFKHFLIGGGSEKPNMNWNNIIEITKYLRTKSSKNIYLMSLPIINPKVMNMLYDVGITEIGFNIEIFDSIIARKYMPGKGCIDRDVYYSSLQEAVKIWGNKGAVRSLIIVGLEPTESLLEGVEKLCRLGVCPILSIFRPLPETSLSNVIPPDYNYIKNIFTQTLSICRKYDLLPGPDCIACQNNTLSLPPYLISDFN